METQNVDDRYHSDDDDDNTSPDRGPVLATLRDDNNTFNLYEGDNIVGRSDNKDLDVKLRHETVSDVHANLELSEEGICYCKDLASNNGNYAISFKMTS